ncbi:hypothetical protein ANCDUO_03720 [Ancylostoma duodenale]|uniref:Phlebovirus glycoprotein G2 fusion domain-containing protein n=1 Tax=Ancylostoma duodenale TaxID=51022 RepID=A0A0C2GWR8_9BILA|nr:hypothetical protein ANCDUO_03720 [Ancylostoma duodenale]
MHPFAPSSAATPSFQKFTSRSLIGGDYLLTMPFGTSGCRHVNVLEHHSTICTYAEGKKSCSVQLSEILKIKTFKQEACLRLTRNSTLVANIKSQSNGTIRQIVQDVWSRAAELVAIVFI